jgi:iron(III) transport system ATP-binding protein
MNPNPLLEIEKVHCGYNGHDVVDDFDLRLAPGEMISLLGSSGCGKTTVLRAIAGFEHVNQGQIRIDGQVVSSPSVNVAPELRRVGMVFQDYALFPHLTIANNIIFGLKGHDAVEQQEKAGRLLELVGMEGFGDRYPDELSGGQQQRVAVARALAPEPRLLLLDEPFSNLDTELRERLAIDVRDMLQEQNIAAIFVTHDQHEAFVMGERTGIMHEGRLLQYDNAFNLYHEPVDRFVADFIGQGRFLRGEMLAPDKVRTELGTIRGDRAYPWDRGTRVDILVRPDDVLIDEDSPMRCRVRDRAFRGAETLYTLGIDGTCELLSLMPSRYDYQVGEEIGIEIDIDHLVLFPSEA